MIVVEVNLRMAVSIVGIVETEQDSWGRCTENGFQTNLLRSIFDSLIISQSESSLNSKIILKDWHDPL